MGYRDYLAQRSDVAGGEIVLIGTRVPLRTVLASLADGDTFDEILKAFPTLTLEHLQAAASMIPLRDQP